MALMKKLAPGGTIDQNALNDNINSELSKYNLTSKDERKVRDALVQLRDYMSAPEGKSFSVDPVAGKYTISGVGSEKFQGSPDEIKSNWLTGKLKIKDDQDAMSVAAAIYGNASKSNLQNKEKSALNMQNLGDYLSSKFGNQDNFNYALNQLDTDDKRKQAVYDWSKSLINDYKNTINSNSDKYTGADLEKVNKLEHVLNSNDSNKWDNFVKTSFELGWSPQNFLLSQEQKEQLAQKNAIQEVSDWKKSTGITNEETLANLYKFGYKPYDAKFESKDLNNLLASKHIKGFKNDLGKIVLIDPNTGQFFNHAENLDYFNRNSNRLNWNQSYESGMQYYKPKISGLNFIPNMGTGLHATGLNPNESLYAWNSEQNPNDIDKLQIQENGHTTGFATKDSHGNWIHPKSGNIIHLTGYSGTNLGINNYDKLFQNVPSIDPSKEYDVESAYNYLNSKEPYYITSDGVKHVKNIDKLAGAAVALKKAMLSDKVKNNLNLKRSFHDKLGQIDFELSELKKQGKIPTVWDDFATDNTPLTISDIINSQSVHGGMSGMGGMLSRKKGGVLKAQAGMSFKEWQQKYNTTNPKRTPTQNNTTTQIKDASGTLRGQSTAENIADAVSIGGTIASFVPGLGVVGGLVSTGADIAKDVAKDGFQWSDVFNWNTAANLGFTALAGIGLGGLKTASKALKVAEEASKFEKLANVAEKVGTSSVVKNAAKTIETLGIEHSDDIAKNLNLLEKGSDESLKLANKILGVEDLGKITKETAPIANQRITEAYGKLKQAGQIVNDIGNKPTSLLEKVGNLSNKVASSNIGNYVTKGLGATQIGSGIVSGANIINDAKNNNWDFSLIKSNDVKNVISAAALSKMWLHNNKVGKAIENFSTEGGELPKTSFKVGDKEVSIDDIIIPDKKSFVTSNKDAALQKARTLFKTSEEKIAFSKEQQKLADNAYKEKLADVYNTVNPDNKIKADDIDLSSLEYKQKISNGERTLIDPSTLYNSKDLKNYELAKKALSLNKYKPYSGFPVKNNNNKEVPSAKNIINYSGDVAEVKPITVLSDEQKNSLKDIYNKRLLKNLQNKTNFKNKKEQERVSNRISELQDLLNKHRKGGVLKAEEGIQIPYLNAQNKENIWTNGHINTPWTTEQNYVVPRTVPFTKYNLKVNSNYNNNTSSQLPYYKNLNNEWWSNNQSTPKFTNWINSNVNEQFFNKIKLGLNDYIKSTGSKYQVNNYNQYKNLLNDKFFGPVKNYTISLIPQTNNSVQTQNIENKPVTSSGVASTNYGNSGIVSKIPNILKQIDATDLANLAMYVNTWNTNKKVGNEQRQAIAASMYTLPYQEQQYLRINSPYSLLANKQAGTMQSNANRIAASTSDLNKSIGIQLQGASKANEIVDKGNLQDQQRIDQLRSTQDQMNARVNAANIETLGKNRALSSQAFSKIHQINANESLTQGTNLNNFILGTAKNIPVKQFKTNQRVMYEAYSDPKFKQAQLNYQNAVGDEGKKSFYDQWSSEKNLKGVVSKPWEESTQYNNWQNYIKEKQNALKPFSDNFERLRTMQTFNQPLYKSGGTLSKEDRIEIENEKSESKRKLKDTEIAFKSILNNNQMLQKALIKVFK